MSSIRSRGDTGMLFFDFRCLSQRFREQTLLSDTKANRKRLQKVLGKIDQEIQAGTFVYADYFPGSKALKRLERMQAGQQEAQHVAEAPSQAPDDGTPDFATFARHWFDLHVIEWRRSYTKSVRSTIDSRLIPVFGQKGVSSITRSDILAYRATLGKVDRGSKQGGLSNKRINEVIGLLCRILGDAADEYQFTSPALRIKRLRIRKVDVQPFNLDEVRLIISSARKDYRNYFAVRLLTGMRTGEVHGLKWKFIDFDKRLILIRETFVLGQTEYTKTDGSQREIQMSEPVFEALMDQYQVTGQKSEYVFCNRMAQPLDNKNFTDRVWYPLLRHLGLDKRRPYQIRHTAATLWLASGEAPEWIARQLGHTSTEMLFRVYSRYVPNLTRQDGSAMDRLLATQLASGRLVRMNGQDRDMLELVEPAERKQARHRQQIYEPRKPFWKQRDYGGGRSYATQDKGGVS